MIEPEQTKTPQKASTTPAVKHSAPMDIQKASLAVRLNQFMQAPGDPELERRFASMLINAQFETLVAIARRGEVSKTDVKQKLVMSVGVTTYLADGKKYIPVFTDPQVCQRFIQSAAPNVQMRTFSFTSKELMSEVKRLGIAGLLINPGRQSFPLTQSYWNYASQVFSAIDADAKTVISLLDTEQLKRADTLIHRAKHIRGIEKLWVASTVEGDGDPALAVIAAYKGDDNKFQRKVAAELARSSQDILSTDQDVLVGTTRDDFGQKVAHQCAPVFTASHLFGRRPEND